MIPFTTYHTIRIDGQYDPKKCDVETAVRNAVQQTLAEADSNMKYNGETDGWEVTQVVDCGESI